MLKKFDTGGVHIREGFTLIELLVVIAIIGLLSSIILSTVSSVRVKARGARRIADLTQIRNALEQYYLANGFYPQSSCGWDCNGYFYSTGWGGIATDLATYLRTMPIDPINNPGGGPWDLTNNYYIYSYGNVGRNTYPAQYDLTARLEDTSNPQRCGVRPYRYYFTNTLWCGSYSTQIYEASTN